MFKPRLMLVDDDDGFRDLWGEILLQSGYQVLRAPNGNVAIRLCEKESVALALVDMVMPEKEGLETIFELRSRFPEVKIIATSGGARGNSGVYLQMARKMGADAVIAKPFVRAELLEMIQRLLQPGDSEDTQPRP